MGLELYAKIDKIRIDTRQIILSYEFLIQYHTGTTLLIISL